MWQIVHNLFREQKCLNLELLLQAEGISNLIKQGGYILPPQLTFQNPQCTYTVYLYNS
jgi:hypothetical protein